MSGPLVLLTDDQLAQAIHAKATELADAMTDARRAGLTLRVELVSKHDGTYWPFVDIHRRLGPTPPRKPAPSRARRR